MVLARLFEWLGVGAFRWYARKFAGAIAQTLETDRGVRAEDYLTAIGALAGYAAQAAIRAEFIDKQGMSESEVFDIVVTEDGRRWFCGNLLTGYLAGREEAVLNLTARAVRRLHGEPMRDLAPLFARQAALLGKADFGVPDVPEDNFPILDVPAYLRLNWRHVGKMVSAPPQVTPVFLSAVIEQVLKEVKGVIDLQVASRIVMESAIAWSMLDLDGEADDK